MKSNYAKKKKTMGQRPYGEKYSEIINKNIKVLRRKINGKKIIAIKKLCSDSILKCVFQHNKNKCFTP